MDPIADMTTLEVVSNPVIMAIVGLTAWRLGMLTMPGAIMTACMGIAIVFAGGWVMITPIVVFFGTSSLLSYLPHRLDEKAETRTIWQVLSNGFVGTAGCCLLFLGPEYATTALTVYIGAAAAANADTWATEIGTRYGGSPKDIMSGRTVDTGDSGAISTIGTVAAFLGAFVVAAASLLIWPNREDILEFLILVTLAGWVGSMADSLVGAVAQVRYRCRKCGQNTEETMHCGIRTSRMSGFLTNNHVNWICSSVGAFVVWVWL